MIKVYEHFITWYDLFKYYIQNQQEFQSINDWEVIKLCALHWYLRHLIQSPHNLSEKVMSREGRRQMCVSSSCPFLVWLRCHSFVTVNSLTVFKSSKVFVWLFGFSFCWFGWLVGWMVGWLDCRFLFLLFVYQFKKKSCFCLSPMLLYWHFHTNLFSLKCSRPTKFLFFVHCWYHSN